jgi:ADP-dependent NAD(P)H-hydrate dehydratase / NAD(P)H-hydrate epimerase
VLPVVEMRLLEPVKLGYEGDTAVEEILAVESRADAIAIGPGLGRDDTVKRLVREVLERSTLPAVVDADALFGLEPVQRPAPTVLTPHSGELARLLGETPADVDAHRLAAARRAADRFGAVVLLKGADTIVVGPGGNPVVCDLAPPSLATAGSGDVLTGVIAAFLAKGMDAPLAAAAGAVAHGIAASLAPAQPGLIASDVVAALPQALT